uniref:DNA2/NAM7 helicase-like C-terminal domain-containing protein n=1 Tax=Romanomermis culicivorax TaxID=13658 RepID=A0A915KY09_ROMCU
MYHNSVQNNVKKVNVNGFPDDRYLPLPTNYPTMISGFPIAWVNVTGQESLRYNSCSIQNVKEARAVVNLAATLIGLQKFKNEDIVIITSHSVQVKLLHSTLLEACKAIMAADTKKCSNLFAKEYKSLITCGEFLVLGRHPVLIHLHIPHNIFRILVRPLSKLPYSMYEYYHKNNITFISENAKTAQMFEFMCSYIMTTCKYNL